MNKLSVKQTILIIIAAVGAILIFIFQQGFYPQTNFSQDQKKEEQSQQLNQDPAVVSTEPPSLNNSVIVPGQAISLTFNYPLQNLGEFKHKLDPKIDYKLELSGDRKTVKISPIKDFPLGSSFTLTVLPDSKFDSNKILNHDIELHFRTVDYNGV